MSTYSISFVERLTGVKAHTLRIWEQRYPLVEARRTPTNIRFYDDEQLKQLLNISVLIQHGYRIGQISKWSNTQFQQHLNEISQSQLSQHIHYAQRINQLIFSSLKYDEEAFSKAYIEALNEFGLIETYTNILYPMLVRIGLLWSSSELIPAHEHFISHLLKQKMMCSIEQLPINQNGKTCVLFLPEEEEHELGLLFTSFLLKSAGYHIIYLGPKVPLENVIQTAHATNAQLLLWFIVKNTPKSKVQHWLSSLHKGCKGIKQVMCADSQKVNQMSLPKHTVMVHNPAQLIPAVANLFNDNKR